MSKKLHEMTPAEYDAYRLAHGFGLDGKWMGAPILNPPMPYYVPPEVSTPPAGAQLDLFGAAA